MKRWTAAAATALILSGMGASGAAYAQQGDSSAPIDSGKWPPVCSSWNWPTRNVGTLILLTQAPGERSSYRLGVRNGFSLIS